MKTMSQLGSEDGMFCPMEVNEISIDTSVCASLTATQVEYKDVFSDLPGH